MRVSLSGGEASPRMHLVASFVNGFGVWGWTRSGFGRKC